MSNHTHQTAPTRFIEANGIRFAYRRFGRADGGPLVSPTPRAAVAPGESRSPACGRRHETRR
jgi:hypothetical protein